MIVFSHRPLLAGKKRPATSEKNVPSVCFQLDCLLFFFFTMGKRAGWSVPYLTCHHVTSVSLSLSDSKSFSLSLCSADGSVYTMESQSKSSWMSSAASMRLTWKCPGGSVCCCCCWLSWLWWPGHGEEDGRETLINTVTSPLYLSVITADFFNMWEEQELWQLVEWRQNQLRSWWWSQKIHCVLI